MRRASVEWMLIISSRTVGETMNAVKSGTYCGEAATERGTVGDR